MSLQQEHVKELPNAEKCTFNCSFLLIYLNALVEGQNNRKPIPQILTDCHENDCLAEEVMRKEESEYNNYLKFEIAIALFLSFPAAVALLIASEQILYLIHISEPTRRYANSYDV